MTIAQWLSDYPPLCDRIAAVNPGQAAHLKPSSRGGIRALAILATIVLIPVLMVTTFKNLSSKISSKIKHELRSKPTSASNNTEEQKAKVENDLAQLADFVEEVQKETGHLPPSAWSTLSDEWTLHRSDQPEPTDPFNYESEYDYNLSYYYAVVGDTYFIKSVGPDGLWNTKDDIMRTGPRIP